MPDPSATSCRIAHHTEESCCDTCGAPLYVGDRAYLHSDTPFCSLYCAAECVCDDCCEDGAS
jgi:hypothetical protein